MSSSKKEFVGAAAFYAQHHWAAIQSAGSTDAFAGREHDFDSLSSPAHTAKTSNR